MSLYWVDFNLYLAALGISPAVIGLVATAASAAGVLTALPAGAASDRVGRRLVIVAGLALMTAAVAGFLVVRSAPAFIVLGALFGAGQEAFFVLANPYLSEHSRPEHRNELFALQAAIGNITTVGAALVGGLLAAAVAALGGFDPSGPAAYRVIVAAMVVLLVASIAVAWRLGDDRPPARRLPRLRPRNPDPAPRPGRSRLGRWVTVSDPGLFVRLLVPGFLISVGAGQCIPFLNLYIQRKFGLDIATLNSAFAVAALGTAVATLLQPALARRFGQMGSVVAVQAASIPFLVVLGWVPVLPLVLVALAVRNALMNAGNPILSAFAMERADPAERATLSAAMSLVWSAGWVVGGPYYSLVQASLGFDLGYTVNFVTVIVCYSVATVLYWWWFVRPGGGARHREDRVGGVRRRASSAAEPGAG
jgi:MFS family permease